MKKMKTTIAATVALAACVSTQLFAQNTKEDTITFALTVQQQVSVSTSATVPNAGTWSAGPTHYKTISKKLTQVDILKAIAIVRHSNPSYYTSQAKLVLVQGELGGFWNLDDNLASSYADTNVYGGLTGTFNDAGLDISTASSTSISEYGDTFANLATGRHFLPVPAGYETTGQYPIGHMQPWGQIFVKDPGHKDSLGNPLCDNVTYFFALSVQECYDCFYLNSFISDANFVRTTTTTQNGPPCCSTTSHSFTGKGVDKYYLTLSFDNTQNNSFLNPSGYYDESENWHYYNDYAGYTGLHPSVGVADGLTPDLLPYVDLIKSGLGAPSPYEVRFTLNGIVTYSWAMKLVNSSDLSQDYVGTAVYSANGYGFIGLVCSLLTGTTTFSEKIVKATGCCEDIPWYDCWYGPGWDGGDGYYQGSGYDESPFNPQPALTYHNDSNWFIW